MAFNPDGIATPGIPLLGCSPPHHDEVQNGLWGGAGVSYCILNESIIILVLLVVYFLSMAQDSSFKFICYPAYQYVWSLCPIVFLTWLIHCINAKTYD